jgi:hypothetical protein
LNNQQELRIAQKLPSVAGIHDCSFTTCSAAGHDYRHNTIAESCIAFGIHCFANLLDYFVSSHHELMLDLAMVGPILFGQRNVLFQVRRLEI